MTKNVVDSIIGISEKHDIALIPSRRQIEFSGGYVNNWTTEEFCSYVRARGKNIILQRDHGGPGQGAFYDDGYESLKNDTEAFDLIHIDPWKVCKTFEEGTKMTADLIKYCDQLNPLLNYEVGTEESIFRFDTKDLNKMLSDLKKDLGPLFSKIRYAVIQSGTSLSGNNQTGKYNTRRLVEMTKIVKDFGLLSKEHNGDYLKAELIREKMNLGLDSINIAPEFGLIETDTYLDFMNGDMIEKFWRMCYESKKWEKWVDSNFDPHSRKMDLIKIAGHYVISSSSFQELKTELVIDIDMHICNNMTKKLYELFEQ